MPQRDERSSTGMMEEARHRLRRLIAEARVATDPSPHLVLDDVFPAPVYERFQAALPGLDELRAIEGDNLRVFPLWDDSENSDGGSSDLGRLMNAIFTQELAERFLESFMPALTSMYGALFGSRAMEYRNLVRVRDWRAAGALDVRPVGNVLPAHTDWPNRLVSVVVYLAPPDEAWREEWGTRLYRITPDVGLDALALMAKKVDFPDALIDRTNYRLLAFRPNRTVAFMNTPWSIHGAEVEGNLDERRWAITKGINLPSDVTEKIFGLPVELRGKNGPLVGPAKQ